MHEPEHEHEDEQDAKLDFCLAELGKESLLKKWERARHADSSVALGRDEEGCRRATKHNLNHDHNKERGTGETVVSVR